MMDPASVSGLCPGITAANGLLTKDFAATPGGATVTLPRLQVGGYQPEAVCTAPEIKGWSLGSCSISLESGAVDSAYREESAK